MPMDELAVDRFQEEHHILREIFGSNFSVPIQDELKAGAVVLDLGCGPGTWLCDMVSDYRSSLFYGVDFINFVPFHKPKNVQLIQCNILDGIPFNNGNIDYIHIRFLSMAFTPQQWQQIMCEETLRLLRPGGWVEILEPQVHFNNGGPVTERICDAATDIINRPFRQHHRQ
ncbi:hypothetical protein G9A89_019087 [Geosiphon pyriformis]|nr:hypothetical protein G9A89_019087 [Geosiphon pyriformis]